MIDCLPDCWGSTAVATKFQADGTGDGSKVRNFARIPKTADTLLQKGVNKPCQNSVDAPTMGGASTRIHTTELYWMEHGGAPG